ncbi:MAG: flagellar biosynthesis anti-sigma factor FlgM [Fimbriimonadaceae bacterium]
MESEPPVPEEVVRGVVRQVIRMPDREDRVAEIRARIEAGDYNPTGYEIAEAMIRRAIADRVR